MFLIDFVPCPPFFVPEIYYIFINETILNSLNETTVGEIIKKCSIQIPTTTTTTTTTTTPEPTTTSTTPVPTTTSTTPVPTTTSTSENATASTAPVTIITSFVPTNPTTQATATSTDTKTVTVTNVSETSTRTSKSFILSTVATPTRSGTSTTSNVTIVTDMSGSTQGNIGCTGVCLIGIITGAVCLCILLLLIVGLSVLFKKGRESKRIHRSRSRNRYGDFPDVDLYDSIDIEDISYKRNSGTSFLRRSGDFSTSATMFDNPAYRRSFEFRSNRNSRNSWYDPDATNYEYSQINANLVTGTSRSPANRRSVSASRLHDHEKQMSRKGHSHRESTSSYATIHDYVPQSFTDTEYGSRYGFPYSHRNGYVSNGVGMKSSSYRDLQRKQNEPWKTRPDDRGSNRSRSFDPYSSTGSWPDEAMYFSTMDDSSRSKYKKKRSQGKSKHRSRKDKHIQDQIQMENTKNNRFYRSGSTGRDYAFPRDFSCSPNSREMRFDILSSNLQSVHHGSPGHKTPPDMTPDWRDYRYFDKYASTHNQRKNIYETTKL